MKKSGDKLFWISYSDLMTSLFFVMLVLFAVVTARYLTENPEDLLRKVKKLEVENRRLAEENEELKKELSKQINSEELIRRLSELTSENKRLKEVGDSLAGKLDTALATLEQQKRIIDIDKQFKPLKESDSFVYDEGANKYVAKEFIGVEIFDPNKSAILPEYLSKTESIGKEVESMLKKLHSDNPDLGYVLVIEGNAANSWDRKYNKDDNYGYTLSYGRALAVYQHWRRKGIDLRKYNTEILIAGSGFNGFYRDKVEDNNKRFTIQIIPKVRPATK